MMDNGRGQSSRAGFGSSARPTEAGSAEITLGGLLGQAVNDLRASSAIAFVPVEDGRTLEAAVVVGHPLSVFTTVERLAVADPNYTAAAAYRTGRQVVASFPESGTFPCRRDVTMPFPYTVASFPATVLGRKAGVVSFVWVPPLGPREILAHEKALCVKVTKMLARDLKVLGEQCVTPGRFTAPHFRLLISDQVPAGQEWDTGKISGISLLYHVGKLASALAEAAGLKDVIEAVVARLAHPAGAQAMAALALDRGRPQVIGYSGYPEAVTQAPASVEMFDVYMPSMCESVFFESESALAGAKLGVFATGMQACALLPLVSGGNGAGALVLAFDHPRSFGAEERAWLVTMAGLVAQSVERARLFDVEHALAQELQQGLLPHTLPHIAELETTVRYFPTTSGGAVGGDWYDILTLPDGRVGFVIGDVEGHSPTGAGLMGQIRSAVRAYAAGGHGPAEVLKQTNALLVELGTDLFATCCCVWIDCADGTAEIASAGHSGPLLCPPDHRVVALPEVHVGPPLGVAPDAAYRLAEVRLSPGTIVALFTDGLVHSHSLDLGAGMQKVFDILAEGKGQRLEELADRLTAIAGDMGRRDDDVALLLARYEGALSSSSRRVTRMFVQRHDLRAVKEVRRFIRDSLHDWGYVALTDESELLATELVTNALIHADSEVDVRLCERTDRIRIEVRDSDPRPPVPAPIAFTTEVYAESEHGRGLIIVESLATAWGEFRSGRGKSVWFEMSR